MVRIRRSSWVLVSLGVLVGAAACGPAPLWTQSGANAGHSLSNPAETALGGTSASRLHTAWSVPSTVTSSAVVDGSTLFDAEGIGGRNQVVARDLASGRPRWTVTATSADRRALAADGAGGTLYALGAGTGTASTLTAYAQSTGQQRWTRTVDPGGAGLTFGDGRLFVSGDSGTRAYDASGRFLWGSAYGGAGGSYAAGRYYAGSQVFDAATGRLLFRNDLLPVTQPALPQVSGNRTLVAGDGVSGGAIAVYPAAGCGASTCRATRTITTVRRQYGAVPTSGDTVLALTFAGVDAYSLTSGARLWSGAAENDVLGALVAGDLAWTRDPDRISAYRLGGCGAPTCTPVARISTPGGAGTDGFLVTQGKLVTWGSNGVSAYSV